MFVSPNVYEQEAQSLSLRMGMPLTKELGSYLGHQIVHHRDSRLMHEKVLQKLRDRFSGWKSNVLSRANHIVKAKSVLSEIPIFFMQVQKFPASVHKEIDKLIPRCLRGELESTRKIHMVNLDTLCKPKAPGGVNLRKACWVTRPFWTSLLGESSCRHWPYGVE